MSLVRINNYLSFFVSSDCEERPSKYANASVRAPSSPPRGLLLNSGDTGSESVSEGSIIGLERCDLLCASANSLRRASSSRSNLRNVRKYWYVTLTDALSSEDLDVKSSSVPHAHTKYEQEVGTRPERGVVEKKDSRDICENSIGLQDVALLSRRTETASVKLTKLPKHKV
jgi:hypothetical protein